MSIIITMPTPPSSSTTVMEITIISTEGLNNYKSYFNPTIKPFITITKLPSTPTQMVSVEHGGSGGARDHKFRVPVDHSFFQDRYSCLYLQLFTKRRIVGPAQLGWCLIPASDIGFLPPGSVRYLSYRLRAKDGSRGHAVINISVRFEGHVHVNDNVHVPPWLSTSVSPTVDTYHTVIGIPVTAMSRIDNGDCGSTNSRTNTRMTT